MASKKYELLYQKMKKAILCGEYCQGARLPSKRVMADQTGLSQITVATAYGMLEEEGYLIAKERSGYFVSLPDGLNVKAELSSAVRRSHLPPDEVTPLGREFESSVWFKTIRKVIAEQGDALFTKSPNRGCAVLRNAISDYLYRYRGMTAEPHRIIIGSGSEQLYESVVKLLGRDRIFGVESPCYEQIRQVYTEEGVTLCDLAMGEEGIRSEALTSQSFDVLHVTPFHSYPSGVTASAAKRYEYLQWAERTGNYIVEDDFDSEFFLPGHPIASLYFLDAAQSVIYLNTFSKSLSPAIRVGYMILPERLLPVYEQVLGSFSCSVPVLDQHILAEFISSGNFERHLNRMRRRMKQPF